ncbi:hypothetical protein L0Z72_12405 [candidate division KSB1 bacterium]|nr:hypothetical protein [candidate division KSB1 bacterium]
MVTKNAWRILIPAIAPESAENLRATENEGMEILADRANISPQKIPIDPQIQIL